MRRRYKCARTRQRERERKRQELRWEGPIGDDSGAAIFFWLILALCFIAFITS